MAMLVFWVIYEGARSASRSELSVGPVDGSASRKYSPGLRSRLSASRSAALPSSTMKAPLTAFRRSRYTMELLYFSSSFRVSSPSAVMSAGVFPAASSTVSVEASTRFRVSPTLLQRCTIRFCKSLERLDDFSVRVPKAFFCSSEITPLT